MHKAFLNLQIRKFSTAWKESKYSAFFWSVFGYFPSSVQYIEEDLCDFGPAEYTKWNQYNKFIPAVDKVKNLYFEKFCYFFTFPRALVFSLKEYQETLELFKYQIILL